MQESKEAGKEAGKQARTRKACSWSHALEGLVVYYIDLPKRKRGEIMI